MHGLPVFFAAALILSYLSVNAIRYFAERHEILDIPNERSSHTQSVPRGGGLAIVILTLAGAWLFLFLNPGSQPYFSLLPYTVGAVLIVVISWLDDLRSQPNWLRFAVHSTGALLAIYNFGFWHLGGTLNVNGSITEVLGFIITFLWIVGLTNAYNFMDGIDGIAGSQAIVAGLFWAVLGWISQQPFLIVLGLLLAASSLGFLFHNWPPALIFMGDVGSAFLGFTFAVLPLISNSYHNSSRWGLELALIGILPLWPFVFDSTFTVFRRLRHGENIFSAHRSHLYQRLVIGGYSHRLVSLLYTGLTIVGSLLALGWILRLRNIFVAVAIILPLLGLALWTMVVRREHKEAVRLRRYKPTYADPV